MGEAISNNLMTSIHEASAKRGEATIIGSLMNAMLETFATVEEQLILIFAFLISCLLLTRIHEATARSKRGEATSIGSLMNALLATFATVKKQLILSFTFLRGEARSIGSLMNAMLETFATVKKQMILIFTFLISYRLLTNLMTTIHEATARSQMGEATSTGSLMNAMLEKFATVEEQLILIFAFLICRLLLTNVSRPSEEIEQISDRLSTTNSWPREEMEKISDRLSKTNFGPQEEMEKIVVDIEYIYKYNKKYELLIPLNGKANYSITHMDKYNSGENAFLSVRPHGKACDKKWEIVDAFGDVIGWLQSKNKLNHKNWKFTKAGPDAKKEFLFSVTQEKNSLSVLLESLTLGTSTLYQIRGIRKKKNSYIFMNGCSTSIAKIYKDGEQANEFKVKINGRVDCVSFAALIVIVDVIKSSTTGGAFWGQVVKLAYSAACCLGGVYLRSESSTL